MARPTWDEYFIQLSQSVASRATCDRGKSGCVIVKDKRVLCTGYVGAPPGMPHCDEVGHLLKKVIDDDGKENMHCMRTTHAEMNAIIQAARFGISLQGATIYCKMGPCRTCAMAIISAGIKRVVCEKRYHGDYESVDMFKTCNVEFHVLDNNLEQYTNQ